MTNRKFLFVAAVAGGLTASLLSTQRALAQDTGSGDAKQVQSTDGEASAGNGNSGTAKPLDKSTPPAPPAQAGSSAGDNTTTTNPESEKDGAKTYPTDEEIKWRDLAAQEGMAQWAKCLLWVSAIQLGLSVVGIFLVWKTLKTAVDAGKDTERMIAIASRNADASAETAKAMKRWADSYAASERAIIHTICNAMNTGNTLLSQQMENILRSGNPAPLQIRFRYTNLGRTAALVTEISANADWGIAPDEMTYNAFKELDGIEWICMPQETLGPLDIRTRRMERGDARGIVAGDIQLWVWGRVRYETVLGDKCETTFCRRFDPKMDDLVHAGGPERNRRT